jgi:aspartate-semialdehyde dehydrogenase
MSTPAKARPNLRDPYRVAIVGAATLKGKEVAEMLNERNFPAVDVKLLDDDEALGQLEAVGDAISFVQSVRAEQFEKIDFTFFASDQECTHNNWKVARHAGSALVDLSYALEDQPEAMVRSPWVERQLGQAPPPDLQPGPVVVAHPAAVVLAVLLLRTQQAGAVARAVATVFEPVSERGQKGMDELHEQTVNLLSFQPLPRNIYDAQVAFNLLARYGDKSQASLEGVESRIQKHYQTIAGKTAPGPSVAVVQAPIFHGHAFAVYVEMEQPVAMGDLSQALSGDHVTLARTAEDWPNNVNAAGQANILLAMARDTSHDHGVWLWAASDNLRLASLTAVECAETMEVSRPRGTIQ